MLAAALIAAGGALAIACVYQSPRAADVRGAMRVVAIFIALVSLALSLVAHQRRAARAQSLATAAAFAAATALALISRGEWRQRDLAHTVLAAPESQLAVVGRHIIAGYRSRADILPLIKAGAVGGVFITARNVQGRNAADLAAEIAMFQRAAREHGRPALVIATDQEGGRVSRLSPPLPRPARLAALIPATATLATIDRGAIHAAALKNGQNLARIGITLNFAPVADLNFGIHDASDRYSRIAERAISADPAVVSAVARAYCDGLAAAHVQCTLKHFPGLGRVKGDTHLKAARLATPVAELDATDWRPFRDAVATSSVAVMVGHVTIDALDATGPASMSLAVIDGVLRRAWGFDGIVVTDDLCMAATSERPGGTGAAAVAAVVAGADYVLVSFDEAQVYPVLEALLHAAGDGRLTPEILAVSAARMDRLALNGQR